MKRIRKRYLLRLTGCLMAVLLLLPLFTACDSTARNDSLKALSYDGETVLTLAAKGRGPLEPWAVHNISVSKLDKDPEDLLQEWEEAEDITYRRTTAFDPNAALLKDKRGLYYVFRHRPDSGYSILTPACLDLGNETMFPFPTHILTEKKIVQADEVPTLRRGQRLGIEVEGKEGEAATEAVFDEVTHFYDDISDCSLSGDADAWKVTCGNTSVSFSAEIDPENGYVYLTRTG